MKVELGEGANISWKIWKMKNRKKSRMWKIEYKNGYSIGYKGKGGLNICNI